MPQSGIVFAASTSASTTASASTSTSASTSASASGPASSPSAASGAASVPALVLHLLRHSGHLPLDAVVPEDVPDVPGEAVPAPALQGLVGVAPEHAVVLGRAQRGRRIRRREQLEEVPEEEGVRHGIFRGGCFSGIF